MLKTRRPLNVIHGSARFEKFNRARDNPAAELKPIYLRIKELLLGSTKITVDETRAPVLDPLISTGCAMQSAVKMIGGKGVIIGACNVALMVQSKMLSDNAGVCADATARESAANIIPGDVRVPGW